MKVRDIMTADVVTVGPEDSLKDVASILFALGISGLPVCDGDRRVLGVISEADILHKELDPKDRRGLAKASARTAGEAMSAPPITISRHAAVTEAARLMTLHRIKRLPVVNGTTLVGIVTRADLVRAFVRSDEEIERELLDDVVVRALCLDPNDVRASVEGGNVRLAGTVLARTDALLLERLALRVPGVVSVESDIDWRVDDMPSRTGRARVTKSR